MLWEASDRICGKRKKPLLPVLLPALEHHGHLHLEDGVREQVLAVSASSIDRLLITTRESAGHRHRRHHKPGLRRTIPVRTFADWGDPVPGFVEADLVAHCGESMSGSFAYTLMLTDIASGWAECIALLVREGGLVVDALEHLTGLLPFRLRSIDTEYGTEFPLAFALTCQELGIRVRYIKPRRPQQNGKVERSHRIDQEEFWGRHEGDDFDAATRELALWAHRYNHERFSMALAGRTPMEKLAAVLVHRASPTAPSMQHIAVQ
ncbi:MAG: integrase core domain-containing protein [Vicinamibacterales bacterium]